MDRGRTGATGGRLRVKDGAFRLRRRLAKEAGMRWAVISDRGMVRKNNEDCIFVDEERGIFLLADGMGGGPAGEVASRTAVEAARDFLARALLNEERQDLRRMLADALAAAHAAVAQKALADPALKGMGTTLEILVLRGAHAHICHVGDSRVYHQRGEILRRITNDDNYAALLAASGAPYERIPAAFRSMLTQVVGLSQELVPELPTVPLASGDRLLICSDGLTGPVSDREIAALLREKSGGLDAIAKELIAAALEHGGDDNVSVIIIEPDPLALVTPLLPAPQS